MPKRNKREHSSIVFLKNCCTQNRISRFEAIITRHISNDDHIGLELVCLFFFSTPPFRLTRMSFFISLQNNLQSVKKISQKPAFKIKLLLKFQGLDVFYPSLAYFQNFVHREVEEWQKLLFILLLFERYHDE